MCWVLLFVCTASEKASQEEVTVSYCISHWTCVWASSSAQLTRLIISMLLPSFSFFFFLNFPISSPFISYTQEGLWQNNTSWKEKKKQIKTTFFQHRVCTVGPHELPGLEKQLGKLLLNRGNSFPRICLEMVWQVRALLWIHSKPAPLGVQHNLQEQPNQKHLSACHHSLWQRMYLNVQYLQVRPHNRNVLKWPGLLSTAVFDGGASIGALTDCLWRSCFCLISGTALVL